MKVTQLCPKLCNPVDYTVHGILQARILELVAVLFSRGSSQPMDQSQVSCTAGRFFTSRVTREAQEYWRGWPIPSPVDLPNEGIKLESPALQADSLPAELPGKPQCPQKSLPKKLKKLKNYLIIIDYIGNNQLISYLNSINIPHTSYIPVSKRGKKWYPFQGYDSIGKCLLKVHYMFMYNHISVCYNNISYSFLNNSVTFINSVSACYYMEKFSWINKAIYPYA